jgi:hypothetical protein
VRKIGATNYRYKKSQKSQPTLSTSPPDVLPPLGKKRTADTSSSIAATIEEVSELLSLTKNEREMQVVRRRP